MTIRTISRISIAIQKVSTTKGIWTMLYKKHPVILFLNLKKSVEKKAWTSIKALLYLRHRERNGDFKWGKELDYFIIFMIPQWPVQ